MFLNSKRLNFLYGLVTGILLFLFVYLLVKTFPVYGVVFSFLWKLLSPFIIASVIAYLLYPVIEQLHRWNIHRGIAILFIYTLFFGGIGYLIYRIYPRIVHQVQDLVENFHIFTDLYNRTILSVYEYTSFLPETVHDKMDEVIFQIEHSLDELLSNLIGGFTGIFDAIVMFTVIPVLVFYFLKDFKKMKAYFQRFIPKKYRNQTVMVLHAIDDSLGKYIRGQLLVCLFVGLASLIFFKLLKLKYALLLAVIMAITNLIPYFGPIIGAIPAAIITFSTTESIQIIFFLLLGIFIIQLIEGNLLSPYIVGKSVAIHPAAIIFALILGSNLFGVAGMVLAVPVLTVIRVIVNHLLTLPAND